MIQIYSPLQQLATQKRISERKLAIKSNLARNSVRGILQSEHNLTLTTIESLANVFDRKVQIIIANDDTLAEHSATAVAIKTQHAGFDSWKVNFFNFVDEFRRTLDARLIILSPPNNLDLRLKALLAAMVVELCRESSMQTPIWASKKYYLPTPWFVAGIENLKASAILESPLPYRNNNIFVLKNFLSRV